MKWHVESSFPWSRVPHCTQKSNADMKQPSRAPRPAISPIFVSGLLLVSGCGGLNAPEAKPVQLSAPDKAQRVSHPAGYSVVFPADFVPVIDPTVLQFDSTTKDAIGTERPKDSYGSEQFGTATLVVRRFSDEHVARNAGKPVPRHFQRRRLARHLLRPEKVAADGGLALRLAGDALPNACKTCALGMGGQRAAWSTRPASFPEVCKKSLQAMAADMQGAIKPEFWSTYSIAQLQAFSPRELESCGRLVAAGCCSSGAAILPADLLGRRLRRIAAKLQARRPTRRSGTSAAAAATRPASCCNFSPGCTARTTSTTAATTAIRPAAWAQRRSAAAPRRHARRRRARRPGVRHRRQPGQQSSAADDDADARRRRGGEVIVINPVVETGLVNFRVPERPRSLLFGTQRSPRSTCSRTSAATWRCLTGIAKRLTRWGLRTRRFLRAHCTGSTSGSPACGRWPWTRFAKSGVSRGQIDQIAERYAAAKNVVFSWTMGITHHAHGVANVQAIANLALMRGMVGRPNAGLMPIRGHSNVQGIGSVGVTPKLKEAIFDGWSAVWRQTADDARARHAGLHRRRRDGRLKWASAWAAICMAPIPTPRSPPRPSAARHCSSISTPRSTRAMPRAWPRDDHPAGAGARRRAAADDAGIDVQLCPPERRRPAAARRAAERGGGDRRIAHVRW
jgi:hypothetical protein